MDINNFLKNKRYLDIYILARYFYRIGKPIMTDATYDLLERKIRDNIPEADEYLNRTYDDDPIPIKLLEEIGVDVSDCDSGKYYDYLNEEKSFSIKSVTEYESAFKFFSRYRDEKKDLMTSMKLDGNFSKSLYVDGNLLISLSRGRSGNSFDFTDTIKNVLPNYIGGKWHEVKVFAECFVDNDYLPVLREKYGSGGGYVSPKSAAISMLRVKHDEVDYEHLKVIPFFIDGVACTISDSFKVAEDLGFNLVPHKLIKWGEIPSDKDEFCVWLKKEVFDYFAEYMGTYASDGIVVDVDDLKYIGYTKNQYVDRQLALKFEQWGFDLAQGVVEDIIWEQRRVCASVRLKIKPVTVRGTTAKYINAFSPAILIKEGINVGSTVYFERNSDAYNVLVYGDRLKEVLGK